MKESKFIRKLPLSQMNQQLIGISVEPGAITCVPHGLQAAIVSRDICSAKRQEEE